MIGSIASVLVKLTFFRALLTLLASIAVVLPAGLMLLKFFALPLLLVLAVVGLPLIVIIALLGFPFFIVFGIAGIAMALLASVVSFGFIALKIFLFVLLPIWLMLRLIRWMFRSLRGKPEPVPAPAD